MAEEKQEEQKKPAKDKFVKVSEKEIENYHAKIGELTDMLQRLHAEFQNYKKRIEIERCEFVKYSNAELLLKLLPIIDSFEMALKSTGKQEDFVKGIELIYSQFYDVLEKEGIKRIEALNKKFDHNYHEVMMVVENGSEPDTIIEELQPGYTLNGRVIRPTKVKISKKKVQK
jgi:molecular chaperone GrpE